MADDDNNTAAKLPVEEEDNCGGDIEQGRSSSSWAAAAVSGGGTSTATPSTTTTTWPLGGLEHVDVEEAAPKPLIQQIADMEIEKDNTSANIHAEVAPSEDASTTPQPPTQDAMEQIEDGDDGAAPRPLNYAEFEDKSEPKLDLGHESADEDEGPPLPLPFQQRDSMMAATSQISSSAAASCIDRDESVGGDSTVGDEENILQRVVGPEPESHSASDNEGARRVVSAAAATAAERYPSVPIIDAYLVEEDEEGLPTAIVAPPPRFPVVTSGGHDTVYEATPLEPELPWWKQRRTKVFMVINCILIAALALSAGLGVVFSRPSSNSTGITITTTAPIAETDDSSSSSVSLSPSQSPTKPSYRCFADRNELKAAVDRYVRDGCGADATLCRDLSDTYGWPMGSWCVINVTDMSSLFEGLDTFNEDISMWNVSHVADMSYMFQNATSFNQNMCAWQDNFPYSSATDIFVDSGCAYKGTPSSAYQGPFCASACNTVSPTDCFTTRDELKAAVDRYVQGYWGTTDSSKYGWPIGSWCVGKVTDMSELFRDLDTFNEDISGWEVGQVTEMEGMFYGASSFNQTLSNWDTSAVTNMKAMFFEASAFNGNISSWDTSAVTDMSYMFNGASSFNQEDLSKWNTSAVTTMKGMFNRASAFDGNISSWDTSAVTDMSYMFDSALSFNQKDLSNWDTSAVTNMYAMFSGASVFDGNISSWNTSAVTDMSYMFWAASSFNQKDLSNWETSAVTTMREMFTYASAFDGNISSWDSSAVTDMSWMFWRASSFNQNLSQWNTSAVTYMSRMFANASAFDGDISSWDTSAVTDMRWMFNGASSFNQNLCAWKDNFPYSNADGIFVDSGCTFQGGPQIVQQGPFCASDCTNS